MLLQELFDIAIDGWASQGFECSLGNADRCLYRGPNGKKCPVGYLIPDEVYRPTFEDNNVSLLLEKFPDLEPRLIASDCTEETAKEFLVKLQYCHDLGSTEDMTTPDYLNGLRGIAAYFDLSTSKLEEIEKTLLAEKKE